MTEGRNEISFALQHRMDFAAGDKPHILLLAVGQDFGLEMLPNPFTPRSTISRRALGDLERHRLLPTDHGARFPLRDLSIAGAGSRHRSPRRRCRDASPRRWHPWLRLL